MSDQVCLSAQGLEFARHDNLLFSELNFELHAGQALHIEGANGCGKTTLLRILCGLLNPDRGKVTWNHQDIREHRFNYQQAMSYVGHAGGVKGDCTPLENLALARSLSCSQATLSSSEALARVGLKGYGNQLCHRLSAGQNRRVSMARLLVSPTQLWILDEPLTAIDQSGIADLESLMADHVRKGGMIVLTSHHAIDLKGIKNLHLNVGEGQ